MKRTFFYMILSSVYQPLQKIRLLFQDLPQAKILRCTDILISNFFMYWREVVLIFSTVKNKLSHVVRPIFYTQMIYMVFHKQMRLYLDTQTLVLRQIILRNFVTVYHQAYLTSFLMEIRFILNFLQNRLLSSSIIFLIFI